MTESRLAGHDHRAAADRGQRQRLAAAAEDRRRQRRQSVHYGGAARTSPSRSSASTSSIISTTASACAASTPTASCGRRSSASTAASFSRSTTASSSRTSTCIDDRLGVLLEPGLWHTMHSFSSGCVVLVAASDYFDERGLHPRLRASSRSGSAAESRSSTSEGQLAPFREELDEAYHPAFSIAVSTSSDRRSRPSRTSSPPFSAAASRSVSPTEPKRSRSRSWPAASECGRRGHHLGFDRLSPL